MGRRLGREVAELDGQRQRRPVGSQGRLVIAAVAVLAIPTTGVEAATRRLALALGLAGLAVVAALGLLLSWVDRLGLRPIAAMTDAADAITRGETDRRVPLAPAGTEAERLGRALNTMIDTSTAEPSSTNRLRAAFEARGCRYVDAPLARTPKEAEEGRLNTMVGATDADIEGVVDALVFTTGAEVACLIVERPQGRVKLSLRSRQRVDVAVLARAI